MNQRIFEITKSASKRLKSPKLLKTEANHQQNNRDYYIDNQCKSKSFIKDKCGLGQRDYSEKQSQFTKKKLIANNYSQESRQQINNSNIKYNCFLDSNLKLNKFKAVNRVPLRSRKQMWHNYVNTESSLPERRVQSQINILKSNDSCNKNRSTASLCTLESQDTIQFNIKYIHKTRQGQLATNPNKVNQDVFFCQKNLVENLHLFFVCDGHGQNGHQVSNFIQTNLPNSIRKDKLQQQSCQIKDTLQKSIQNISVNVNKQTFDTNFSGSTLNGIILQENGKIYSFNVGDSRTVIGKFNGYGSKFKPYQLSVDHKLTIKKEQYRVISSGGKIDTFYDQNDNPIGPMRVWVNGTNYPGLAMSRSIGDQVAASIGVSNVPDIVEYQLGIHDKFIIIASDGIWEFLDNQIVVDIIGKYYQQNNIEGAGEELIRVAYRMWTIDDDSVVDDITFIIIFIQKQ